MFNTANRRELVYSKQPIFGLTQEWFRELSFSRLECGVHDRLHIYPLCGIFYFTWHRHPERRRQRLLVSHPKDTEISQYNVESQFFTPNNSRLLARGSNSGRPRDKLASYHWTTAPLCLWIINELIKVLMVQLFLPLVLSDG